jgi:DtxR family Mn-dependent transcriptional regulator
MYLITVYRLTHQAPHAEALAAVKDIAGLLGVSLPSVSERVKRLREEGYLHHQWRQGVTLTETGRQIALNVLRKHRLVETFLVTQLGYRLDEIHAEACNIEHAISNTLANRLDVLLNYPRFDPHGHPIPDKDGHIAARPYGALASLMTGQTATITQVSDWDSELLTYLCDMGLTPGTQVSVTAVAPFDGPLTLNVGGQTVALSQSIAATIGVEVAKVT